MKILETAIRVIVWLAIGCVFVYILINVVGCKQEPKVSSLERDWWVEGRMRHIYDSVAHVVDTTKTGIVRLVPNSYVRPLGITPIVVESEELAEIRKLRKELLEAIKKNKCTHNIEVIPMPLYEEPMPYEDTANLKILLHSNN